jgi:hypothetical protein
MSLTCTVAEQDQSGIKMHAVPVARCLLGRNLLLLAICQQMDAVET